VLVDLAAQPELDAHLLNLAPEGRTAHQPRRKAQLTRDYLIAHGPILGGVPAATWSVSCKTRGAGAAILAAMEQRMTLITLGYGDFERARDFYTAMGWTIGWTDDDVVFFQAGGMVLSLWDRARLAEDSCVENSPGWGGVTLALNLGSPAEVDTAIEEARRAGATIGREPAETFWGGYSGVFVDPDGHPWEVAHNPHWRLTEDGVSLN
jgi:uncharacterized protein